MFIHSFLVLFLSAILLVGIPVFGEQLQCPSDYGITFGSFVLKKDGVVVPGVYITGGQYTMSGTIQVYPGAALPSIDAKFDVWVTATGTALFIPFKKTFSIICEQDRPCVLNGLTCSYLASSFGISNLCDANSAIYPGIYTFEHHFTRSDESSMLNGVVMNTASATITIQLFDSSNGGQVGCLRKEIPILLE
ncbi:uncharacterized protein LOC116307940 [Actinia tenebrosa]|uniref:Uncharacterized protein LOC116307940 n=1 Tax=Actinia tenebrosa TaxID=6105 RepID=A0A6P8J2D7_ACTTE|nr:uncharacterized protein LOC116307940 [Actinia tenebrosa]